MITSAVCETAKTTMFLKKCVLFHKWEANARGTVDDPRFGKLVADAFRRPNLLTLMKF